MSNTAVRFDSVSKKFTLSPNRPRSFQESFFRFFGREKQVVSKKRTLWVLREIAFEIKNGQTVGLIGINGAGKSTILKLICRIIYPTSGDIKVNGRVIGLLELGASFHPELTGRENAYLTGSLLGIGRKEMEKRFDPIVDFSGLGDFIDVPVKHYSSGMFMRLGFSTIIQLDADILLIDEILAVGDRAFQQKCLAKIAELQNQDKTIVFVSHNLNDIRELCDRVMWIDGGGIRAEGAPAVVTARYLTESSDQTQLSIHSQGPERTNRWGNGQVEILWARLVDEQDEPITSLQTGDPASIIIRYRIHQPTDDLVFGFGIYRADGLWCYGTNTDIEGIKLADPGDSGEIRIVFEQLPLLQNNYRLDLDVHSKDGDPYDCHRNYLMFSVWSPQKEAGIFRPSHRWILNDAILGQE